MWIQKKVNIHPKNRGFHIITDDILKDIPELEILRLESYIYL